jgi:hypothetical protein
MNSGETRKGAASRLDVARGAETSAARNLDAVRGTLDELHAAVQLGASRREVAARSAWLAWVEEGESD